MSYVDDSLMPGEFVIARARVHWWVYARALFMLLVAICFAVAGVAILAQAEHYRYGGLLHGPARDLLSYAIACFLVAAAVFLRVWLGVISAELAVTDVRVIVKTGLIRRASIDLLNGHVESLLVRQSILGRILNFGTVTLQGTGVVRTPSPLIADPLAFRHQAMAAIKP